MLWVRLGGKIMDDLKSLMAGNEALLKNLMADNKAAIDKIIAENQTQIKKLIAENQTYTKAQINAVDEFVLQVSTKTNHNPASGNQIQNEIRARVKQALIENRSEEKKVLAEIQQSIEQSLQKHQKRMDKTTENGCELFSQSLNKIHELSYDGMKESQRLLEEKIKGRSSFLSRNLPPRYIATQIFTSPSLRPLRIRHASLRVPEPRNNVSMLEQLEYRIKVIEGERQTRFVEINDRLAEQLDGVEKDLGQQETAWLKALAEYNDQVINRFGEDLRRQNKNFTEKLKQIRSLKAEDTVSLYDSVQREILRLEEEAIRNLYAHWIVIKNGNTVRLTSLFQQTESLQHAVQEAIRQVGMTAEERLTNVFS
jgi:hypothetical protein